MECNEPEANEPEARDNSTSFIKPKTKPGLTGKSGGERELQNELNEWMEAGAIG
jgi:hypothetical protein